MEFILGIITGVGLALTVFICAAYFESRGRSIVKYVINNNPVSKKPEGFIIEANDHDEQRKAIIKRNNERGLPTQLSDL